MRSRRIRIILVIAGSAILAAFLFDLGWQPVGKIPDSHVELPQRVAPNPYLLQLLTEFEEHTLKSLVRTGAPGVAIAVVKDTSVVYLKGFGVRQVGLPDSIDVHSVFRLASVSKCFAPILTGLLVEEGILSWDDPVIRYVPDFKLKKYTDSLTIRHVLSHTTGLPYHTYTNLIEDGMDLQSMLARLRDVELTDEPGEIYSYQNVAYSLIAEVIRGATGKSYEQLMKERIFQPLKMGDASITYQDILLNKNVARPHHLWRKGWRVTSINDTYYNVSPAGGINASISDMAKWMKVLVAGNQRFIGPETLGEIFTPFVKARSKNRNFRKWVERADSHYALGWRVLNFSADTLLYHGGYVNGYRSEIAIDRANNIGICVLSNGPGSMINNCVPYFFHLYYDQQDSIGYWEREREIMADDSKTIKR